MKPPIYPLILGSQSPRRRRLLNEIGLRFRVVTPKSSEKAHPKTTRAVSPAKIVREISEAKAIDVLKALPNKSAVVVTADTLVFLKNKVLGKPKSPQEAAKMLRQLSGNSHNVFTGVTVGLVKQGEFVKLKSIAVRTSVKFFPLSSELISWYVGTKEPMDKAGAYGAQEYGSLLVKAYSGSYTNVVGLPVGETLQLIETVTGHSFHHWIKS